MRALAGWFNLFMITLSGIKDERDCDVHAPVLLDCPWQTAEAGAMEDRIDILEREVSAIKTEIAVIKSTCCLSQDVGELNVRMGHVEVDLAVVKADVQQLKEDVRQLKTELAELRETIAELAADLALLRAEVATLRSEFASLRSDMDARFALYATKEDLLQQEIRIKNWTVRFGISLLAINVTIQFAMLQIFR